MSLRDVLRQIYFETLRRSDTFQLTTAFLRAEKNSGRIPTSAPIIALGKCAVPLFQAAAAMIRPMGGFIAVPRGYLDRHPEASNVETAVGTHPHLSEESFEAGDRLVQFAQACREPAAVLISGGSSACVEVPLKPWFLRDDLQRANTLLLRSGLPIEQINVVRKHLSAIKGGRLAARLPVGSRTLIYSDVSSTLPGMVGSGPTLADPSTNEDAARILRQMGCLDLAERLESGEVPETVKLGSLPEPAVIADNRTLVAIAAAIGQELDFTCRTFPEEIEGDVVEVARWLYEGVMNLPRATLLVGGGEATVRQKGDGRGGRCTELAARVARLAIDDGVIVHGLFASSDGVDGNSGAAGVLLDPDRYATASIAETDWAEALGRSDSARLIEKIGEAIIMHPTGNNLRDLIMLARG